MTREAITTARKTIELKQKGWKWKAESGAEQSEPS